MVKIRLLPVLMILMISQCIPAFAQKENLPQALNHYVLFLDESARVVMARFAMLARYQSETAQFRKKPDLLLRLPSSGPLEKYYYEKALNTPTPSATLTGNLTSVWQLLNDLDVVCKQLETHVRLEAYRDDNLKQSDELVAKIQSLCSQFSLAKDKLHQNLQRDYNRIQPYNGLDIYLFTEKAMKEVILSQKQLLDSLPYYYDPETKAKWPVDKVRHIMLADEKFLATISSSQAQLQYPASDMLVSFKASLASMHYVKRQVIDGYTFAARQNAEHGNAAYLSLIKYFNQDLLATYKAFVNYSQPVRSLLYYPAFSPVFAKNSNLNPEASAGKTEPFEDSPYIAFQVKEATAPASAGLIRKLNDYVEFINESLRQMHMLQLVVRNYQSSAEYYRDPVKAQSRSDLNYSHEKFEIPSAAYALLINAGTAVPEPYRASVNSQTTVLMNILKEMDALSIELTGYTSEKIYLRDQLKRSDAILDRYPVLFETFDQKKEQLYLDLRQIHDSFPAAAPESSWIVAGNALQQVLDDDRAVLFGVKKFLKNETQQLPPTDKLDTNAKRLIAGEYQNLKGLQRYGRSNGLCPYSPYEDLAANTSRFAIMAQKVKPAGDNYARHPFDSFYYFYNNELVYQYNNFVELAKGGLLKAVNQPDLFIFTRNNAPKAQQSPDKPEPEPIESSAKVKTEDIQAEKPLQRTAQTTNPAQNAIAEPFQPTADTVYVERVRVDTVFIDRTASNSQISRSLEGFAPNNMVLLLDVSSSMNSPLKMPLLKRSIKSMLTLLRPEDQLSIVLYSGKARVVLKPTSGKKSADIARMIDLLKSDGDTDGNEGLRLAYKTASKQYIRGGNNRIVLATDGEFPVSDEVTEMIGEHARQDLYLTILTFGRNAHTGQKLKKLSLLGKGTYAHVTEESADLQLILEAQGKKLNAP